MASRTQHFKGFSIVQGDIKVDVSLARFEKQFQDAQFWLDNAVMESMIPFMPQNGTGNFVQRTQGISESMAGTGIVCAGAEPMGRFLYEGKVMVDELTGSAWARKDAKKVATDRNLDYFKGEHPAVTDHWFDAAKQKDLKEWVKNVKRIAGGGANG